MRSVGKIAQVRGGDEAAMLNRVDGAGLFKKTAFGQRPEEARRQTMRHSGEEFSRCREQCVQRPWGKTVSDVTSGRLERRNWVIRGGEKFVGFKAKEVLGADCIGSIDRCKGNFAFYPEGDGEPSKGKPPVSLKHWIWGMRDKAELSTRILRQRSWRMELPLVEMDKSVFGASLREQTQKFSFLPVSLRSWEGSLLCTSGVWEKRPDLEIKIGEMSVYRWHLKPWA